MKRLSYAVRLSATIILFGLPLQMMAQYRNIDSLQNLVKRPDDSVKVIILNHLSAGFRMINLDSSIVYGQNAAALAEKINFKYGRFKALENQMHAHTRRGEFGQCLVTDKQCLALAEEIGDKKLIALSRGRLGITYIQLHHEARGFEEISKACSLYEELGDKEGLGYFLINLGNTYAINNDLVTARKYYRKAEEASGNDPYLRNLINLNQAEALQKEKKFQESFSYLDPALRYHENIHNENAIGYILRLKGIAYRELKDSGMASKCFQSALKIYDRTGDMDNRVMCLTELADLCLGLKQPGNAKAYLDEAARITTDPDKFLQLSRICKGYAAYYAYTEDYRQALIQQEKASALLDSFQNISQKKQLNDLQIKYETDQAEKRLEELSQQKRTRNLIILSFVLVIIPAGIMVFRCHRKQVASLKTSANDIRKLEHELFQKNENEQQLKNEIEFKLKELTAFTLNMIQKKEMLEKIKAEIELVKEKTTGENRSHLTRIISTINFSQHLDKDWCNFKLYFEQVHQGFFDNLQASYPDLNSNDLKLCALIKLNLDTKQIASVMDISPESAKVAKYRIRKKLGLTGQDNLTMFFATISNGAKQNGLVMPPRRTPEQGIR